jgi:hypothetical protein
MGYIKIILKNKNKKMEEKNIWPKCLEKEDLCQLNEIRPLKKKGTPT